MRPTHTSKRRQGSAEQPRTGVPLDHTNSAKLSIHPTTYPASPPTTQTAFSSSSSSSSSRLVILKPQRGCTKVTQVGMEMMHAAAAAELDQGAIAQTRASLTCTPPCRCAPNLTYSFPSLCPPDGQAS
mmetsp:Transcript_32922/g.82708  ORF Transcript_32922/g.82708 Transcript_32922/m.82708 type:complete len:128 (-) Transcript_32922:201-584(-)